MTPDQLRAAQARVPFAWGIKSSPGGLVHDFVNCTACQRDREASLEWVRSIFAAETVSEPMPAA